MGFLGVLRTGAIDPRFFGQILLTEIGVDQIAATGDRILTEGHAVGTHIGDQARGLAIQFDTFIKALGDPHGLGGAETKFPGRFLLQGRGGEGRLRVALCAFLLDRGDPEGCGFHLTFGRSRGFFIGKVETFEFLTIALHQTGGKAITPGAVETDFDGPVFLRLEDLDLGFPLTDQAEGNRLDAAGRA